MEYIRPYIISWTKEPTVKQIKEAISDVPDHLVFGGHYHKDGRGAIIFRTPFEEATVDELLDGSKLICGYFSRPIIEEIT